MIGDAKVASEMAPRLLADEGIYVIGFVPGGAEGGAHPHADERSALALSGRPTSAISEARSIKQRYTVSRPRSSRAVGDQTARLVGIR